MRISFYAVALSVPLFLTAAIRPDPAVRFERNSAPDGASAGFIARGQGYALVLEQQGLTLDVVRNKSGAERINLRFSGANRAPRLTGQDRLAGVSNYLIGSDETKWRRAVPHFGRVAYESLYPGIDMVFYGAGREIEYDLIVRKGADPDRIRLAFSGQKNLSISDTGDLILTLEGGQMVQRKPFVYQEFAGGRREISARYRLLADGTVGVALASWDRGRDLVIDPVLSYASYWGGSANDLSAHIAVDAAGNIYLFGDTASANFPVTPGASAGTRPGGPFDNYITKFGPNGQMIWSTFLGGNGDETAVGIAVDATGSVYVAGSTSSSNFPVSTGAPQGVNRGGRDGLDAFVAKLNPTGTAIVYASYLGGNGDEIPTGLAVGPTGDAYVAGSTLSTNFPTTVGSLKTTDDALLFEGFLTRFAADGASFVYSTYVGGNVSEIVSDVAVDAAGNAYLVGSSGSQNFPVVPIGGQTGRRGLINLFVMKINPQGNRIIYGALLGGTSSERALDIPTGIAVDAGGNAYVTASVGTLDFPVTDNAIQKTLSGSEDAAIFKVSENGGSLVYSTLLGGLLSDSAESVAVDGAGNAFVLLTTASRNLPLVQPFQDTANGGTEMYIAKINPAGSAILQSSYLGGSGDDRGRSIVIDSMDRAYVSGRTSSSNIAGVNGAQRTFGGGTTDSFFARVDFATPAAPPLSISPERLTFTGETGAAIPAQMLSVVAPAGTRPAWTMNFTATPPGWLVVTPTSGTGSATVTVTMRTTGLLAGTYNGSVTLVNTASGARTSVPVTLTLTAPAVSGGQITSEGVVSAASFTGGGVSPGLIANIFGQRIGPDRLTTATVGTDLKFPTVLAETRVLFDGVAAPIVFVSMGQLGVIVPYSVAGKQTTQVVAEYRGVRSAPVAVPVVAAKPGLFTANSSGRGPGAILNQNATVNSSSNPADKGSIIVLYATGEGETDPPGVDGAIAANSFPKPKLPVAVRIGGINAEILYAGAAPSLVAGVLQINVRIPENVPSGDVPVQIIVGTFESPAGVTVAVN